jgi:hypothetical protein
LRVANGWRWKAACIVRGLSAAAELPVSARSGARARSRLAPVCGAKKQGVERRRRNGDETSCQRELTASGLRTEPLSRCQYHASACFFGT